MMTAGVLVCLLSLSAWAGVLLDRRGFWKTDQRLESSTALPGEPPAVVAVVPARNEARTIGHTVEALLKQVYTGRFSVVVVDDNSTDGTAEAALKGAQRVPGGQERLEILKGDPLPEGWSGKLWAVNQGVNEALRIEPSAGYILLTDADIELADGTLARLVSQCERKNLVLASLMVRLRCRSFWERLLIPAFIFFFQKLYPFPQINNPAHRRAGAAGGCMMVRTPALRAIGGIESIHGALIDDCTLAARLKGKGPIFLGLATRSRSLRPYDSLGEIWSMVARTAYVQLERSPLMLLATVVGMVLLYLVFPVATIVGLVTGTWPVALLGALGWTLMTLLYAPTLRLYRRPFRSGFLLPVAAFLYTLMTIDSARRHYMGRGGEWKGRVYSDETGTTPNQAGPADPAATSGGWTTEKLAAHVEELTRASGTSFYGAMRVLPKPRRQGMYALYAFCRVIDDIADDPGSREEKEQKLAAWRDQIDAIYDPARAPTDPVALALSPVRLRFGLPKQDFLAVIEGMEMDAGPSVRIADMPSLEYYCDRVACAVGRLSNRIFGVDEALVDPIAKHTGLALQFVNILRDVAEDARINRLYLPASRLRAHGLTDTDTLGPEFLSHPATRKVCQELASRAAAEVAEAQRLQKKAPKGTIRPAVIMLTVYRRYLAALNARGFEDLEKPVHVSKLFKLYAALRHGLF
ncbi:presqualene diphosphate synthase HpnD [Phaeovibrio sulfidiphilus]|uniref:Presqualene diphosphate synthase HpnD n=1 Tax=Phaeovibrio sulfidiphilus TaxID=1220600 RepID=A0A8J6YL43_9PROT|nr:presqualene diphosphate synthase HpnD [Phaeovibrio sulfidiphilus]MBE1236685.1 presqualene diphosphate synthase HpnD [Phaeovibrio sulfidiphilus]